MFAYSILVALVFLLTGGGGKGIDLLDTVPTDAYWQLKNVTVSREQLEADAGPDKSAENVEGLIKELSSGEFAVRDKARRELERMGPAVIPQLKPAAASNDPEVAAVAGGLVKQFTERAQERAIRRLMAIRTLGERKEQASLALLKKLVESKELFVSDYALRAAAQVEGKEIEAVDHSGAFAKDLGMMPGDTAILGQVIGKGWETLKLDTMVEEGVAAMKAQGMPPMVAGQEQAIDKKKMVSVATKRVLSVVEMTGNLRLEGGTVAVSEGLEKGNFRAVIMVRGKYDPVAVTEALKLMNKRAGGAATLPAGAGGGAVVKKEGEIARIDLEDEMAVLMPSEDLMVFALSEKKEGRDEAAALAVKSLKAGKGTLGENAKLMGLVNGLRKDGPSWGAMLLNDEMRKEKQLEGFENITMETTRGKEAIGFVFKGHGEDADKVKASADLWATQIKQVQGMIQQAAQQEKGLGPVVDMFNSMKVTTDAKEATLAGEVKPTIRQSIMMSMGMGMMMMLQEEGEGARGGGMIERGVGVDGGG